MGATPANMEVYARLSEAAAAGEFDLDSSIGSGMSQSGRSLKGNHEQQQGQHQQHQQGELKSAGSGLVAGSTSGFAPISEVGQQQQQQQQHERQQPQQRQEEKGLEASGESRAPPRGRGMPPPVPLRRRAAMSDVWQQQGAFRSNRKSMKSMFEEVREGGKG